MKKCCVFFAVRTDLLHIIEISFGFKGLIAYNNDAEPKNNSCFNYIQIS
jgi:hypothetical protein